MPNKNAVTTPRLAVSCIKGLIRLYQWMISPWLGRSCRFYPTCSHYCYQAVECHGFFKGLFLGLRRLLRCHPFHPGGFDPVPQSKASRK